MTTKLIAPHGGKGLVCSLLQGEVRIKELHKAQSLLKVDISARAKGDLIMMGIGGFSPLDGFMDKKTWHSVIEKCQMPDQTFWPIPITLDVSQASGDAINIGDEVALVRAGEIYATLKVAEKYQLSEAEKRWECQKVFQGKGLDSQGEQFWKVALTDHPGVKMVMEQQPVLLAGKVKVLSEGEYPQQYQDVYLTPAQTREIFEQRGWSKVAALQLRNPMHRSHEYLAKIGIEVCDGVLIHSLIGNLKAGDIPASVRVKAIDSLVNNYFVKDNVLQGGYPLDMRYAGPREALLHALFRQNYGISDMIIGRDHAGVGDFYGLFEAQEIFEALPHSGLEGKDLLCRPLKIDWTFYCHECDSMASLRTCPHSKESRVILSGTKLRKLLSDGATIPDHFGRPEVLEILQEYYQGLTEKVEVKMQSAASGSTM